MKKLQRLRGVRSCEQRQARRAGFTGKIAIHPEQVEVINRAFTPSAEEVAYARRVIEAFGSGVGTVSLDGKMLDLPHLKQARRVLAMAKGAKREVVRRSLVGRLWAAFRLRAVNRKRRQPAARHTPHSP